MSDNVFGITDQGRVRANNEDTFIARTIDNGRYLIGCVIDGVGGYEGGEIASDIARETITQHLRQISGDITGALQQSFIAANDGIFRERELKHERKQMACVTTLAVADLETNQFYFAHIGDTRLYLYRDGSLVKISHDQSFVGFLEDSGRLTEAEAMKHPKRNEIDKALGFKRDISLGDDIETGQSPFLPGDILLLCTDGLTDVIDRAAITTILSGGASLDVMGADLIHAANHGGGHDNITVVLVQNDNKKKQHTATRPAGNTQAESTMTMNSETKTKITGRANANGSQRKTYKGWAIFFFIIALVLAVFSGVLYFGNTGVVAGSVPVDTTARVKPRNAQEIKLMDLLFSSKSKVVVLSDTVFKKPIVLTRSIIINQDSLYIKAKGNITFQKDSLLKGPGFILTTTTKGVVFDSVTFSRFGVAIQGRDRSLQLKNVRFDDCLIPVDNVYVLADRKYINGGLGSPQFTSDTAPLKKTK
jgi:serine/threonine protein phosphatase PrpC